MQDAICFSIAGINISVVCSQMGILNEPVSISHLFFGENSAGDLKPDITVRLEPDSLPETGNMKKLFDAGGLWSLYYNCRDYYVRLNPVKGHGQPMGIMKFNPALSEAVIYCGESLVKQKNGGSFVLNAFRYTLDRILIMYFLAYRGGALFHSAGIELNGKGYMFAGISGAGKSTISSYLSRRVNIKLLNDERVAVRKQSGGFYVYGTPWSGETGVAVNASSQLGGIFFINHGRENIIKRTDARGAVRRLLPATTVPWYDEDTMSKVLSFCEELVAGVPAYELFFTKDEGIADVLEEFINA